MNATTLGSTIPTSSKGIIIANTVTKPLARVAPDSRAVMIDVAKGLQR
jgi:hypothetical protein